MQDPQLLMEQRLARLRGLSWEEAVRLPERLEEEVAVAGHACALTTCRQAGVLPIEGAVLVTVQLARSRCFGRWSDPLEQGLVFEAGRAARPATAAELLASGD